MSTQSVALSSSLVGEIHAGLAFSFICSTDSVGVVFRKLVSVFTVRLSCIDTVVAVSPALILRWGYRFKMCRVHTLTVLTNRDTLSVVMACVVYNPTIRDFSCVEFITHAMRGL